eukprot:SAG11_NODE_32897_length_280_cov_0.574586_1_plen_66_part_01
MHAAHQDRTRVAAAAAAAVAVDVAVSRVGLRTVTALAFRSTYLAAGSTATRTFRAALAGVISLVI